MVNTYRTANEADRDKAHLVELFEALHASSSVLRRNADGLWTLRGRPGCYISTWGDGKSWQLVVAPEEEPDEEDGISPRQWTWFKKRLSFCELTQDAEAEGCFRLHRLPTSDEAEVIRDIIGIRKAYSPEELARRREVGRRSEGNLRRHEMGLQPPTSARNVGPVLDSPDPENRCGHDPHPVPPTTDMQEAAE